MGQIDRWAASSWGTHETKNEGEAPSDLTTSHSDLFRTQNCSRSKGVGQKMHPAKHSKASSEALNLAVNSGSGARDSHGV